MVPSEVKIALNKNDLSHQVQDEVEIEQLQKNLENVENKMGCMKQHYELLKIEKSLAEDLLMIKQAKIFK